MKSKQDKKDLELFHSRFIENKILIGHLYIFKDIFNFYPELEDEKPVLIIKIEYFDSVTYFNLGPVIAISILQNTKVIKMFINNKHLANKKFLETFNEMFTELTI